MRLQPLGPEDAPRVQPLAAAAFDDLAARQGRTSAASDPVEAAYYADQHAHLLQRGSGVGAHDDDGELSGVALWHVRGDLWVLSLLVVRPGTQSTGAGSALMRAALDGAPARRVLHASRDARAMRLYARHGFRLLPALQARGVPAPVDGAPALVPASPEGPLAVDLEHALARGGRLLRLADGRGGTVALHGAPGALQPTVLGAPDDDTAAALLRGALAVAGDAVVVGPIAPQEHWAVPVALEAGLPLDVCGPVAVARPGDPLAGPSAPTALYL